MKTKESSVGTSIIGIIGGGVSGLGAAYELRRNALKTDKRLDIHIFEKQPHLGGNADTAVVNLGDWKNSEYSGPYHRWADLGVNDINFSAYVQIARVMKEIKYFDSGNPDLYPNMLELENTETYFTWDSNILLTDDNELESGVSNPEFEIASQHDGRLKFWIDIVYKAANAKVGKDEDMDIDITVAEFFSLVVNHPKETLEAYVGHRIIAWDDPELKRILVEIRDNIFYPRISAMYFANDHGPEQMLLAAPMCYYRTQESKNGTSNPIKPNRRYFVGGSNRWLVALRDNLLDDTKGGDHVKIFFHTDFSASARVTGKSVLISCDEGKDQYTVDYCIVTVHADDAATLLNFDYETDPRPDSQSPEQETSLLKILQSITYTRSTALCHTFAGVLPANRNQWRSYNVLIRQDCSSKPYSMTYLCNRHQNDAGGSHSSEYNQVGLPQFFVTLNPQREVPPQYILKMVDQAEISSALRVEIPQIARSGGKEIRFSRKQAGDPAIAHFKHNLIDKKCFLAQRHLKTYHETAKNLFIGGGWSNGSGLQEECWVQAQSIAQLIIPV